MDSEYHSFAAAFLGQTTHTGRGRHQALLAPLPWGTRCLPSLRLVGGRPSRRRMSWTMVQAASLPAHYRNSLPSGVLLRSPRLARSVRLTQLDLEATMPVLLRRAIAIAIASILSAVILGPVSSANAEEIPAGEFCPGFAVLAKFTVKGSEKTLPGDRFWEHNVGTGVLTKQSPVKHSRNGRATLQLRRTRKRPTTSTSPSMADT